jgi:hypothetical protein
MQLYRYLSLTITAVIFCSCSSLPAQSQPPEVFTHPPPSSSPGHYKPPPLSRMAAMVDHDSGMQKADAYVMAGDLPGYKAELQKQAEAGSAYAQLSLGALYIPRETFAPPDISLPLKFNQNPRLVLDTSVTPLTKLFPPSFPEALKWLTLASAQGSGEASELIAQIITRQLDGHQPTPYIAADIEKYRKLAVQQGYDLENASVRCLSLTHDSPTLTCDDRRLPGTCPTQDELQQLRVSGITGTLQPEGGASGGLTDITMHPGGPPARVFVILDHNVATEQRLPLPRHASAIYVQQPSGWLVLPKDVPVLDRDIVIMPPYGPIDEIMAYVQNIEGGDGGGSCVHSLSH